MIPQMIKAGYPRLFAVNVTAVLPATPSNLGVFQAACVAVLSTYGVGHSDAFAYGIILQAVEMGTAFAMGMPALLREGMTWRDMRLRAIHAAPVDLRATTITSNSVVAGTGRFAAASGSWTTVGTIDFVTGLFSGTFSGWLSY